MTDRKKAPPEAEGRLDDSLRLRLEGRRRDLAMFNLAIDSKLRGCDLVRLRVDDVCACGRFGTQPTIVQKRRAGRCSSRSRRRRAER